jgi:hypothetical protein
MTFKATSKPVPAGDAIKYADELEAAIGEIMNGKRKPDRIPVEPIVKLIQFARDAVASGVAG